MLPTGLEFDDVVCVDLLSSMKENNSVWRVLLSYVEVRGCYHYVEG